MPMASWIPPAHDSSACAKTTPAPGEAKNAIVSVPVTGGSAGTVLFGDSDFVGYPRLSPDGKRLAWIAWNHPDMPWDATTLHVADLVGDRLENLQTVAGGPRESVLEPAWDADGTLYFVSDRSDWWNLYRWNGQRVEPVLPLEAEVGSPLWVLGQSNYALTGDGHAVLRYSVNALDKLGVVDLRTGQLKTFDLPFTSLSSVTLQSPRLRRWRSPPLTPKKPRSCASICAPARTHRCEHRERSSWRPAYISRAEPIEFPTDGGTHGARLLYPPMNADYSAARPARSRRSS